MKYSRKIIAIKHNRCAKHEKTLVKYYDVIVLKQINDGNFQHLNFSMETTASPGAWESGV